MVVRNKHNERVSRMTKSMTAEIPGGYGSVTITGLRRSNGVAGQVSVEIDSTYVWSDDPERPERSVSTLVGSTYGAPLVFITSSGSQCFVRNPERFGSFASDPVEYARRYVLGEEL